MTRRLNINLLKTLVISLSTLVYPLVVMSEPTLSHPDVRMDDFSGVSVALDGSNLLTGAPASLKVESVVAANEGRVYPFSFDGSNWIPQSTLLPSNSAKKDRFGYSVDIDDSLAVVGAPTALTFVKSIPNPNPFDIGWSTLHGAAYILQSDGTDWMQAQTLYPNSFHPARHFGKTVAISNTTIAVGSPTSFDHDRDFDVVGAAGGVYIFTKDVTGAWYQEAYIEAEPEFGVSFGDALALHNDVLVVGIPTHNLSSRDVGAVAIYRRAAGSWTQEAVLYGDLWRRFGSGVAIQDNTLVVGAPGGRVRDYMSYERGWFRQGKSFVYEYDETHGDWNLSNELPLPDFFGYMAYEALVGGFGQSVSIDGDIIAVGMNRAHWWEFYWPDREPESTFAPIGFSGELGAAVYRKARSSDEWVLVEELMEDDPKFFNHFGSSVDVSGECVAVGARKQNGAAGENEGGSFVFCDLAEVPIDLATATIEVFCCEPPFESFGPYRYSLALTTPKSVESQSAHVQVNIESPNGKVVKIAEYKVQLGLDGNPLKLNGIVDLGLNAAPGTYKLSVTMTKNSGSAIAKHQYFDVK